MSLTVLFNPKVATPIIVSVGQVLETDLAQHAGSIQIRSELQALESDTPQQIKPLHLKVVNQPLETDIAQPITIKHIKSAGQALETDISQPVKALHSRSVIQANETDTPQHAGSIQRVSESQSLESNIAQPVGVVHKTGVGQTNETDAAFAVTPSEPGSSTPIIVDIAQAFESDTADMVGIVHIPIQSASTPNIIFSPFRRDVGYERTPTQKPKIPVVVNVGQAIEESVVGSCYASFNYPLFVNDIIQKPRIEEATFAEVWFGKEVTEVYDDFEEIADLFVAGVI